MDTFEAPSPLPGFLPSVQENASRLHRDGFCSGASLDLGELWRGLVEGSLFLVTAECIGNRCVAELEIRTARNAEAEHVHLLERVLLGARQNALAIDLGVACSTVGGRCSRALRTMTYEHRTSRTPLLVAMAAHAVNGWRLAPATIVRRTANRMKLEVTVPDADSSVPLTEAERRGIRHLIAGKTYAEVAGLYERSTRTLANQLAAAFRKLRVSGRAELMSVLIRQSCRPEYGSRSS